MASGKIFTTEIIIWLFATITFYNHNILQTVMQYNRHLQLSDVSYTFSATNTHKWSETYEYNSRGSSGNGGEQAMSFTVTSMIKYKIISVSSTIA